MTTAVRDATSVLAEAWERYLSDTRELRGVSYAEVEPFAWERLKSVLKSAKLTLKGTRAR